MGIFMILVTLLMASVCSSMHVAEGETVELQFPYPCESSVVTLMHQEMGQLYSSANQKSTLPPNHLVTNHNATGNCSLRLTITNVTTQDEGTYLLTASDDSGHVVPMDTMICLRVESISSANASVDPCLETIPSKGPPPSLNPSQNFTVSTSAPDPSPRPHTTIVTVVEKGSEFSALSITVICIFGLYVFLLMCLAVGVVIIRGPEEIFYGRKRDPKAGVRMEGYVHPPEFQA